jgi:hypothetical protein
LLGGLECWWCYGQRDPGLQDNQIQRHYNTCYGAKRVERVRRWQNLFSYVTLSDSDSSGGASSREKRRTRTRAYDCIAEEEIEYMAAGDSSVVSDVTGFQAHGVELRPSDQYIGINSVVYDGELCSMFNWASLAKSKKNVNNVTIATFNNGQVMTKGRALEGNIGAHNLCVVTDDEADVALRRFFRLGSEIMSFAIGGEYRDPADPRRKSELFTGIQCYGLKKLSKTWGGLRSAVEWKRLRHIMKGDHEGGVECRSKCIRKEDGRGICEFDGQACMTYFKGCFWLNARAKPMQSGHRAVQ